MIPHMLPADYSLSQNILCEIMKQHVRCVFWPNIFFFFTVANCLLVSTYLSLYAKLHLVTGLSSHLNSCGPATKQPSQVWASLNVILCRGLALRRLLLLVLGDEGRDAEVRWGKVRAPERGQMSAIKSTFQIAPNCYLAALLLLSASQASAASYSSVRQVSMTLMTPVSGYGQASVSWQTSCSVSRRGGVRSQGERVLINRSLLLLLLPSYYPHVDQSGFRSRSQAILSNCFDPGHAHTSPKLECPEIHKIFARLLRPWPANLNLV